MQTLEEAAIRAATTRRFRHKICASRQELLELLEMDGVDEAGGSAVQPLCAPPPLFLVLSLA